MQSITVQELKTRVDKGEDIQIVDVREEHEVIEYSFGAIHIPMGEIIARQAELRQDVPVVLHCRSGKRSGACITILSEQHGFSNLINLEGGILAWADAFEDA